MQNLIAECVMWGIIMSPALVFLVIVWDAERTEENNQKQNK
jgi:hypothetical protein